VTTATVPGSAKRFSDSLDRLRCERSEPSQRADHPDSSPHARRQQRRRVVRVVPIKLCDTVEMIGEIEE
jgi:hypothetical protein